MTQMIQHFLTLEKIHAASSSKRYDGIWSDTRQSPDGKHTIHISIFIRVRTQVWLLTHDFMRPSRRVEYGILLLHLIHSLPAPEFRAQDVLFLPAEAA